MPLSLLSGILRNLWWIITRFLGSTTTASAKEIKAAYKRLARLRHPDLNGGSPEAAEAFVEISRARDTLIDPKRRAEYDARRSARTAKGPRARVVDSPVETYMQRARSDARIKQNLENFLIIEREEARGLRQAVFRVVALLVAAFFVPLVRPHFWRSSGWPGRIVDINPGFVRAMAHRLEDFDRHQTAY